MYAAGAKKGHTMNVCDLDFQGQPFRSRNYFNMFDIIDLENVRIGTKIEFVSCSQPEIRKVMQKGVWPWFSRSCNKDRICSLSPLVSLTPKTYPWEIFSKNSGGKAKIQGVVPTPWAFSVGEIPWVQGRIKRGHWGHLPRAPISQGAPRDWKNIIIFVLVLICINVHSEVFLCYQLLTDLCAILCHVTEAPLDAFRGAPRLEIGPLSLAQDLARGSFPWPQSCPRVTFLGPDPTQRNLDPTGRPDRRLPTKVWPDPTRPDPTRPDPTRPDPAPICTICFMSSTFKVLINYLIII